MEHRACVNEAEALGYPIEDGRRRRADYCCAGDSLGGVLGERTKNKAVNTDLTLCGSRHESSLSVGEHHKIPKHRSTRGEQGGSVWVAVVARRRHCGEWEIVFAPPPEKYVLHAATCAAE